MGPPLRRAAHGRRAREGPGRDCDADRLDAGSVTPGSGRQRVTSMPPRTARRWPRAVAGLERSGRASVLAEDVTPRARRQADPPRHRPLTPGTPPQRPGRGSRRSLRSSAADPHAPACRQFEPLPKAGSLPSASISEVRLHEFPVRSARWRTHFLVSREAGTMSRTTASSHQVSNPPDWRMARVKESVAAADQPEGHVELPAVATHLAHVEQQVVGRSCLERVARREPAPVEEPSRADPVARLDLVLGHDRARDSRRPIGSLCLSAGSRASGRSAARRRR